MVAVTTQVPEVVAVSRPSPSMAQPVAVPLATSKMIAPAVEPPVTTIFTAAPRADCEPETLSERWLISCEGIKTELLAALALLTRVPLFAVTVKE